MRWIDRVAVISRNQRIGRRVNFRAFGRVPAYTLVACGALLAFGCWSLADAQQSKTTPAPPATQSAPSPAATSRPQTPNPPVASANPRKAPRQFVIVLDPAHGGSDTGAMLAPNQPEKDYTLAFAVRLHVLLNARGIQSVLTRDSDVSQDSRSRSQIANRANASACILLHATASGNGVHLFTSSLPPAPEVNPRRTFLPWQSAQASFLTSSLRLESDINSAFASRHLPKLLERTSLPTLDSMACPAVTVEVAPLNAETRVSDLGYQEKVAEALAAAITSWRNDWRVQP